MPTQRAQQSSTLRALCVPLSAVVPADLGEAQRRLEAVQRLGLLLANAASIILVLKHTDGRKKEGT